MRASPGYYTVKPGDTLIRIGLDSGQSWKDIARWNNMDNPNLIEVGQVLRVAAPCRGGGGASGAGQRRGRDTAVTVSSAAPAAPSAAAAAGSAAKPVGAAYGRPAADPSGAGALLRPPHRQAEEA